MRRITKIAPAAALVAALAATACVPLFVGGQFQTLQLFFKIDDNVPAGQRRVIHTWDFAEPVQVKKKFVQVSGQLLFPGGAGVPLKATLRGQLEDANGKVKRRIDVRLTVAGNGLFKSAVRVPKNIEAGDRLVVSITPAATALAKGSEVTLCIDMVKKRSDLGRLPRCVVVEEDEE